MDTKNKEIITSANALRVAKKILKDKGHIVPTFIAVSRGEPSVIEISEPANTPEARLHQFFAAGHKLAKSKQIASLLEIYFMTSAWVSVSEGNPRPVFPPSKDPNRKEILLITGLNISKGQTVTFIYEVFRDSGGKIKKLIAQKEYTSNAESATLRAFIAGFRDGQPHTLLS